MNTPPLIILQLILLLLAGLLWAATALVPWPVPRAKRVTASLLMGALMLLTFMDWVPPSVWLAAGGAALVGLAVTADNRALKRLLG